MNVNEDERKKAIEEIKEIFRWAEDEEKRIEAEYPATGLDVNSKYTRKIHETVKERIEKVKEQYPNCGTIYNKDIWD